MPSLSPAAKAYYSAIGVKTTWKNVDLQKRKKDLTEPEDDLISDIDIEFKVNLGIRLRDSGHFCKANELLLDVFRQDKKTSQAKELKFTLDCTIVEMKQAGRFFYEEVIWKVAA